MLASTIGNETSGGGTPTITTTPPDFVALIYIP
jgi:hypothetical protein